MPLKADRVIAKSQTDRSSTIDVSGPNAARGLVVGIAGSIECNVR